MRPFLLSFQYVHSAEAHGAFFGDRAIQWRAKSEQLVGSSFEFRVSIFQFPISSLEGKPEPELYLSGSTERVDASSHPHAVYVVSRARGSVDLPRSARQQPVQRGPR